ncbi:NAD(P)/FAD-dependent oxidoreductase [Pseudoneobacillus rhizosphaerae]|uniref:4-methylaminobutanoate oxidase (Formaldehyde-forming) n=1 Tax=Pseudoneobacillus rhizosphaerae TaxID=2880968 RepID=A0A9C7G991_9BACI|nr:FAD-binding oxidoreductase [Pseudoneobacillus rhizosphaerae]CAG9607820.1 4-methylaminobutanoate oxidase (formaldehyde-forming) [Pseudoneobacillus rhizosphaerae]
MKHYDTVIIGAGIIGCTIAYFLARKGCTNVLVIDKNGIASDITGICPGGVRQQWGTEINCLMAKYSTEFFQNINEYLEPEYEIKFRNVGYLYTFHSEEAIETYKKSIALQNRLGIPTKLITPDQTKEIVPGINRESFLAASFCESDGFADDAYHVTNSFASAAKRLGVTFIHDTVERIVVENGVIKGVQCQNQGAISADRVVNAAGLGSKKIAETAGVDLPIQFEVRRILYTNRVEERVLEPLLVSFEKGFAAKQLTDGTIYLSYLGKDLQPPYNMFDFQLRAAEVGIDIFPPLEHVVFKTHLDGKYDSTPDHQAILGGVDGLIGYYQAVGMSGHGFMMSPSIGDTVSSVILSESPSIDISSLHYRRFATNKLVYEPSVV